MLRGVKHQPHIPALDRSMQYYASFIFLTSCDAAIISLITYISYIHRECFSLYHGIRQVCLTQHSVAIRPLFTNISIPRLHRALCYWLLVSKKLEVNIMHEVLHARTRVFLYSFGRCLCISSKWFDRAINIQMLKLVSVSDTREELNSPFIMKAPITARGYPSHCTSLSANCAAEPSKGRPFRLPLPAIPRIAISGLGSRSFMTPTYAPR